MFISRYYWFGFTFAYIQPYLLYVSAHMTTHITMWMTVERFCVITFPLRTRTWFTARTAKVAIIVILILNLCIDVRYSFLLLILPSVNLGDNGKGFVSKSQYNIPHLHMSILEVHVAQYDTMTVSLTEYA